MKNTSISRGLKRIITRRGVSYRRLGLIFEYTVGCLNRYAGEEKRAMFIMGRSSFFPLYSRHTHETITR